MSLTLDPAAFRDMLAAPALAERLSAVSGCPLIVVEVPDAPAGRELTGLDIGAAPAVVVMVASDPGFLPASAASSADVFLTEDASAPKWFSAPPGGAAAALAQLEASVTAHPVAASTLVLLLRSAELDGVNSFLATVLRSLGSAVIVVDTDLTVKVWSPGGEELWGLRAEEAEGLPLPSLDFGLPVTSLVPQLRSMLAGVSYDETAIINAVNRRGRPVSMQMGCTLLRDEDGSSQGVILVMNDASEEPAITE